MQIMVKYGVLIFLCLSLSQTVKADDTSLKQDFFPRNFAEAPGSEGEADKAREIESGSDTNVERSYMPEPSGKKRSRSNDSGLGSGQQKKTSGFDPSSEDAEEVQKNEANEQDITYSDNVELDEKEVSEENIPQVLREPLLTAKYLSPLLECDNPDACQERLTYIYDISSAAELPIRDIYFINIFKFNNLLQGKGSQPSNPSIPIPINKYREYIIKSVQLASPPSKYPIERTPSWIVGTAKGEIILDGIKNPARLIKAVKNM